MARSRCRTLLVGNLISLITLCLLTVISSAVVSDSFRKSFTGIVHAGLGVPIAGAIVEVSGPNGSGYALTSSSGQYRIAEGLKTGSYTVSATALGYLIDKKENVAITAGYEIFDISFYLHPSGGISGKVTDTLSALPLQNVVVVAFAGGSRTYSSSTVTDANGYYLLATNLTTGIYDVTAFFPEEHISKSVEAAVTVGSELKNINLALERSGTIYGRVTDVSDDQPLVDAYVTAFSGDENYWGYAATNATGYYRISTGLGSGQYIVTAYYGSSHDVKAPVDINAGEETPNVDFELDVAPASLSGTIMGNVTDVDGEPIRYALVEAQGPAGNGDAYADQNGNYIISSGLNSGTYKVTASAPGFQSRNMSNVSVTAGHVTANINFQLPKIPSEQSGRISGTVQGDENPIPEFQNPIAIFLVIALVTVMYARLSRIRHRQATRNFR